MSGKKKLTQSEIEWLTEVADSITVNGLEEEQSTELLRVLCRNEKLILGQDLDKEQRSRFIHGLEMNLNSVLDGLGKKKTAVIYLCFTRNITYTQIAEIVGLSRERCRQIEAKALRRLRHPTVYGCSVYDGRPYPDRNDPLILNLSTRAINCLRRVGVTTIEELEGLTDEELMEIRNLGTGTLNEIKEKLKKFKEVDGYGVPEKDQRLLETNG